MSNSSPKKFGYPPEYRELSIEEQLLNLSHACQRIGLEVGFDLKTYQSLISRFQGYPLPERADGWGVALRHGILNSRSKERELAREFIKLLKSAALDDWFGNDIENDSLFTMAMHTEESLMHLNETQEGDMQIFPIQAGLCYAEMSDEEASKAFGPQTREFGLDLLTGASLLAANPVRIGGFAHLGVSLPGTRFDYHHDKSFSRVPVVRATGPQARLSYCESAALWANDHGAMSGFLV